MNTLTYLTFDSVVTGVGASQVRPYLERLADRGLDIIVHSFEPTSPSPEVTTALASRGVRWRAHRFGRAGSRGGLERVARAAFHVRRAQVLHARSDPAAASAMLAAARSWVWDMRSFWADERLIQGTLRPNSPEVRAMRRVENRAAESSDAILVLAAAALEPLEQRHGNEVRNKTYVVPTCVDLTQFPVAPLPQHPPVRLVLSGSLNSLYDIPTMIRLASAAGAGRPTELHVLRREPTEWDSALLASGAHLASTSYSGMAAEIARAHAGLAVCRADAGLSLRGRMPIKIAEFLASGRPVVVNAGLGDMDRLLADFGCGVVVRDISDEGVAAAADELNDLLEDPDLPDRCRGLAEQHFDLDKGVDDLMNVYRTLGL